MFSRCHTISHMTRPHLIEKKVPLPTRFACLLLFEAIASAHWDQSQTRI